jgi:hypothetical protein
MSKILEASADSAGKVKALGVEIPGAVILGEGKQASVGIAIIDTNKAWYIPAFSSDVKTTIEKLIEAIEDIASCLTTISTSLTSIGAGMTGPTTAPPPTLPTDVSSIVSKVAELNATKAALNTLKGALK